MDICSTAVAMQVHGLKGYQAFEAVLRGSVHRVAAKARPTRDVALRALDALTRSEWRAGRDLADGRHLSIHDDFTDPESFAGQRP